MIELTLQETTPSLNALNKLHWRDKHKARLRWDLLIAGARGTARNWDKPRWPKVRLTIIRRSARPIRDHDNFVAGTKHLADALVASGFMLDDSNAVIPERVYRQETCKGSFACTVVRIEPLA